MLPLGYSFVSAVYEGGVVGENCEELGSFMLIVQPTSATQCEVVVVCVAGDGALQYHPRAVDGKKIKIAPIKLTVPLARLLDPAFTSLLHRLHSVTSPQHSHRYLYEVLLPFLLNGASLLQHLSDDLLYETPCRAASSRARTVLSTTKSGLVNTAAEPVW